MRSANSAPWRIGWDVPTELQFGAYIGQTQGFRPRQDDVANIPTSSPGAPPSRAIDQDPSATLELAWRAWWEGLATHTLSDSLDREIDAVSPSFSTASHASQLAAIGNAVEQAKQVFQPPLFPELTAAPDVRQLCQLHWPLFERLWEDETGLKAWMFDRIRAYIFPINLREIVAECLTAAGRTQPASFALTIDLVWWPDDYDRIISPRRLVLGSGYAQRGGELRLKRRLREAIAGLV